MASEDMSRNPESRNEDQMGPFTFHTGTLCGLQPLLLPLGSYPPFHPLQSENPRRDPTKHFPATVTPKSSSCKPDTHLKSGGSRGISLTRRPVTLVPRERHLERGHLSRERGVKSAANKEISGHKNGVPWFWEAWKFWQAVQMHRQEVTNIVREIREAGGQLPAMKVLTEMAKERCAAKAKAKLAHQKETNL